MIPNESTLPGSDDVTSGFCGSCMNHATLNWNQFEKAWMSHCCGEISEPDGDIQVTVTCLVCHDNKSVPDEDMRTSIDCEHCK